MSDKLNELLAGIIADRLPPQWADNSGEVMRWKRIAEQQRVALSIAIEKLQRLQKLEEAVVLYANKYGIVTTTVNGEEVQEGIEVLNQSINYKAPGKAKRLRAEIVDDEG